MFDFPTTPAVGEKFPTPPVAGIPTYVWDGTKWMASGAPAGVATLIISDTAPPSPSNGSLWWDSTAGLLYLFYIDPSGPPGQWVPAVPQPDFNLVNSAFVQKAGDTMTGDLTITKATPLLVLNDTGGANADVRFNRNGGRRWLWRMDNGALETGGNAGSNMVLSGYADDGSTNVCIPITAERKTGLMTVAGDPTAPLGVATKQYADVAFMPGGLNVNGAIDISQEKAFGVGVSATGTYVCDGWKLFLTGAMSVTAAAVTSQFVLGFANSLNLSVQVAEPTLAPTSNVNLTTHVEGTRMARLGWGAAGAQPITLAFYSMYHRPGLYSVMFRNGASDRSYVATYTQAAADVAQYNVITVPGDTTGSWPIDTGATLSVKFMFAGGSGTTIAAINTWTAGNFSSAPGQVNGVGATSDFFRLAAVCLLPGVTTLPATRLPYIFRPYDQELQLCMRYYEKSFNQGIAVATAGGSPGAFYFNTQTAQIYQSHCVAFQARKRISPTTTIYNPVTATNTIRNVTANTDITGAPSGRENMIIIQVTQAPVSGNDHQVHWTADARL